MIETIPSALAGERVDRVVAMLTGCSRAEAAAAVTSGQVRIDGVVHTRGADRLSEGQVVEVDGDPVRRPARLEPDPTVVVDVVYADDHVIVVDKPAGLVVHPGPGHREGTLVAGLLARFGDLAGVGDDPDRPGIVHRLDRGTSGLMLVARTTAAHTQLVGQLARREVERRYRALVWGHLEESAGTVDAPVGRSRRDPLTMTVTPEGRPARTHYEVVEAFDRPAATALLDCRLETGRTHQIRVHLRAIGHPVVGDRAYGGARDPIASDRPFLHARRLRFRHPVGGEELTFDSDLPDELVEVLHHLR